MYGGQALLSVVERAKVDTIVSSPGSEWPPVWDALAERAGQDGGPKFINCRHEAVAVGVAAGYTMVTGGPQMVLLHATAGPLNAAMMLRAAYQERVPMVICTGESLAFGEDTSLVDPGVQWIHDLCDLGSAADLMRRCVKWSDRILSASLLVPSLERAFQIAMEPPAGPVLLSIPFELLMEELQLPEYRRSNEAVRPVDLAPDVIGKAARALIEAEYPVLITENLGRNPASVTAVTELCEMLSIPVMESYRPACVNFPREHPLYLNYDRKRVDAADLVVAAGAVTPWYPAHKGPGATARVIFIDNEFPQSRLPYWGYETDLALVAPTNVTLEQLVKAVRESGSLASRKARYMERSSEITKQHEEQETTVHRQAQEHAQDTPIDPRWLCQVLEENLPEDVVIVEETTTHRTLIQNTIRRSKPQSHFARITGGLGVGLSYGLGVKLAMQDRPVFVLLGDGAFHYNAAPACLGVSQEYGLPLGIVVFNNQRYLSQERSLLKFFPGGGAERTGIHPGASIAPSPDYRLFADAYGGCGIKVERPEAIADAVDQSLRQMGEGKLALLDVVLSDYIAR
ncbi:thiamine pyrophosphate-binding protein [Thermodesulfobacteriota bacterium]